MTESDVRFISKVLKRKEQLGEALSKIKTEAARPSYTSQSEIEIAKSGLFSECPVNIFNLVSFLETEIQALNVTLEKHNVKEKE